MAPTNYSGQPMILVNELWRQGIDVHHLLYSFRRKKDFHYKTDRIISLNRSNWETTQLATLKYLLLEGYNIFHFWQRSLFYSPGLYQGFLGFDIPIIKSYGRRIVYRFTGYDLRIKSEDLKRNPYSVFRFGFDWPYEEEIQKKYLSFLHQYVDEFIVQDPELHCFLPSAKLVPRALNLNDWDYVGIMPTNIPLIIHAPSNSTIKGTKYIVSALEDLKREGLRFVYKDIFRMRHEDAIKWYKKADIIVDQLHVGWYGVVTLEAMALGKPVVVYIREELLDKYEHKVPIQNANPDTIKESLRELIKDFDKRAELGRLSRKYVEEVHDVRKVVPELISIYKDVLAKEIVFPQTFADIDYYSYQFKANKYKFKANKYEELLKTLPKLKFKANKYEELLKTLPKLKFKANKYEELLKIRRGRISLYLYNYYFRRFSSKMLRYLVINYWKSLFRSYS